MVIKRLEDIEREKAQEKREKIKKDIVEDTRDIIEGVFAKPSDKKESIFSKIVKIILLIVLLITFINLVLGNIWLLKFFIKEFF